MLRRLFDPLTTLGELAGAGLLSAGAWQFYQPLGLITAGLFLAVFSWLASRPNPPRVEDEGP